MKDEHLKELREAFDFIERKISNSEFNDSDMYHVINNARISIDELEKYPFNLLTHVLPEESVLWKSSHDMFIFYKCHEDFEVEEEYTSQDSIENFEAFIERTIKKLETEEHERGDEYPIVTIDKAIFCTGV